MKRLNFKLIKLSYFFVFITLFTIIFFGTHKSILARGGNTIDDKINQELNQAFNDETLFTRYLGTGYHIKLSHMPEGTHFNQYAESEAVPKSIIKDTAWYQGLLEFSKHKLFKSTWTEDQKIRKLKDIEAERNRNLFPINTSELKDGFYTCNWVAFDPEPLVSSSFENIYQAYAFEQDADRDKIYQFFTNTNSEPYVTMLRKSQLTEYGFNVTNPNIKEIKSVIINSVLGFIPYSFIHQDKKGFTVHLPSQLKSSQIVVKINYETVSGETGTTGLFAVGIRYNNDHPATSGVGLANKNFKVQDEGGSEISFQTYMKNKVSRYITRGETLKLALDNQSDIQKVNSSIQGLRAIQSDEVPESYALYSAAKDIIKLEYIQTLKSLIKDLASQALESFSENNHNALINAIKFTAPSYHSYHNYLTNIDNHTAGKSINQLMQIITDITYASFNHKLKINIEPMKQLVAKYETMKNSLGFNMYDTTGEQCEKKYSDIKKYIARIEGGSLISDLNETNPISLAGEFVALINQLKPYFSTTPANNFTNPYLENGGQNPPQPPQQLNHYYIELDPNKITSEPEWVPKAYALLNTKVEVKHDNNKTEVIIELKPEINAGVVKKYLTIDFLNNPAGEITVLEKRQFTVEFADGQRQIDIPLKIKITQNNKELKKMWISTVLYDKDKNYDQSKKIDIHWVSYKEDTKEEITGTINHTEANELLALYISKSYNTNPDLHTLIKNALQEKYNLLDAEAKKPDNQTTQQKIDNLCSELRTEMANADLFLKVFNKVKALETEFNSLDKTGYTAQSVANASAKLQHFQTKLTENKASEIESEVMAINTIISLLIENSINYHEAQFVVVEFEKITNLDLLPSTEHTRVNNLYSEIKAHITNQDVTNQQQLNLKTGELRRSIDVIKIYLPIKKSYDTSFIKYTNLKTSGKYTESSINKVFEKLAEINNILQTYDYHNFGNLQDILNSLDTYLVKKQQLNFDDGDYTATIRVMNVKDPGKHSHINSCFSYRVKLVVSGNSIKVLLRLYPLRNKENTITGVITKLFINAIELNYPNGLISTSITHEANTQTYQHPEYAEFTITQDQLAPKLTILVDLEAGTPLFNHSYNEKVNLVIDFENAVNSFNANEVEKRQLVLAYDILAQDIEAYKNKVSNSFIEKVNNLRTNIFYDINNINLSNEALTNRRNEIEKYFNAFEQLDYLQQRYELAKDQVNDFKNKKDHKQNLLYSEASINEALNKLEIAKAEILNKLYDFLSGVKEDTDKLGLLYKDYVRLNTKELDDELAKLLTYKDKNQELVTSIVNKVNTFKNKVSTIFVNQASAEINEKYSLIAEITEAILKIRNTLTDEEQVQDAALNFKLKDAYNPNEIIRFSNTFGAVTITVTQFDNNTISSLLSENNYIIELKNKALSQLITTTIKLTFTKNNASVTKEFIITFNPKQVAPSPSVDLGETNDTLANSLEIIKSLITGKLNNLPTESLTNKLTFIDKLVYGEPITKEDIDKVLESKVDKETYQAKLIKENSDNVSMADGKVFASREVVVYSYGAEYLYKVFFTTNVTSIKYNNKQISLVEKELNGQKVLLFTLALDSKQTTITLNIEAKGMPGSHNVRLVLAK